MGLNGPSKTIKVEPLRSTPPQPEPAPKQPVKEPVKT